MLLTTFKVEHSTFTIFAVENLGSFVASIRCESCGKIIHTATGMTLIEAERVATHLAEKHHATHHFAG